MRKEEYQVLCMVTVKVGGVEDNTRVVRSRGLSNEVMGCFQDVTWKKRYSLFFLFSCVFCKKTKMPTTRGHSTNQFFL